MLIFKADTNGDNQLGIEFYFFVRTGFSRIQRLEFWHFVNHSLTSHPEFISGSPLLNLQNKKGMLNQVQHDFLKIWISLTKNNIIRLQTTTIVYIRIQRFNNRIGLLAGSSFASSISTNKNKFSNLIFNFYGKVS
jgi:hypothetical protein